MRDFRKAMQKQPLLLDGATGTWLQARGMPAGACPEQWVLEHPDVMMQLQEAYYEAGSQVVYAFTFGASRPKFTQHHLADADVSRYNQQLAGISCRVRDAFQEKYPDRPVWVAGNLSPTGVFLQPAGTLSFDELVEIYSEQVTGMLAAGVDLFVIETMFDLAQARAAVIAVRRHSNLPLLASMTLEAHGRTMSGDTPLCCLLALASLGVDAFGLNCSHGPEKLAEWLQPLITVSSIPLMAKPNAGLPTQVDGKTMFAMEPAEFAQLMLPLALNGIRLLGGCCGTGPDFIRQLNDLLKNFPGSKIEQRRSAELPPLICSSRCSWLVEPDQVPFMQPVIVADPEDWLDDMLEAADAEPPAICCDITALPAADSAAFEAWYAALLDIQMMTDRPLIFTSQDSSALTNLEPLLKGYHGRAGIYAAEDPRIAGSLFIPEQS